MGVHDYTIYHVIKRGSRIHGDRTAWRFREEQLTYVEFQEKVDRLATGLLNSGVNKGDRISVLSKNCLEYIYLYGAAAKIGAIMLPVNWRLKADEIEYVISDGLPKLLFVGSEGLIPFRSATPWVSLQRISRTSVS